MSYRKRTIDDPLVLPPQIPFRFEIKRPRFFQQAAGKLAFSFSLLTQPAKESDTVIGNGWKLFFPSDKDL
jgi:hypothetical protein